MSAALGHGLVCPLFATCALAALLLAVPARADVIRVPQDYLHLQVAVNNAVDGDVILVVPGVYQDAIDIAGKALTVIADGGSVTLPHILVRDLAEGQTVVLRGIDGHGDKYTFQYGPWQSGLVVKDCVGRVVVESASFVGFFGVSDIGSPIGHPSGWNAAEITHAGSVEFLRCTLDGGKGADYWYEDYQCCAGSGGNGLQAVDADVGLHECTLHGGKAGEITVTVGDYGTTGGSGAQLTDGRLYASGCIATGTDGGDADCNYYSCGDGGYGGDGLSVVSAGSELWELSNTVAAGKGGKAGGSGAYDGFDGKPLAFSGGATLHRLVGTASSLQAASPVREGQTITLTLHGQPGTAAVAWVAPADDWLLLPKLSGVLLIDRFAPGALSLPLGALAADGSLTVSFTIPELGPGVQEATLFVQGVFTQGAETRLGSASAVVLLDASY